MPGDTQRTERSRSRAPKRRRAHVDKDVAEAPIACSMDASIVILEDDRLVSMTGLEARFSGWRSPGDPLHPFSLTSSRSVPCSGAPEASAGSPRWRQSLGELWNHAAPGDLAGCQADPACVAIKARRDVASVQHELLALWQSPGASRLLVLRSAIVPLECSALIWQAFGSAAPPRHLHLLHRLEDTLAAAERQIHAAEFPVLVNRSAVSRTARAMRDAIDELLNATADPAEALATVENTAVDLSSYAVRIAIDLDKIGRTRASAANAKPPTALDRQLKTLAEEVRAGAHAWRRARGDSAEEEHLGVSLSTALKVTMPRELIALTSERTGDPCLQTDAFYSLRALWLELAVGLWTIAQTLDDLLEIGTFGDEERLCSAVSSRAGVALMASELCKRPGEFDHRRAWAVQREALYSLASDVCLALQRRESDVVVRCQQTSLRRLARALAAIWAIDEWMRSPMERTGGRRS